MRILLDTHVFLWALADDPRLTTKARQLIEEADSVHVSAASIWEISIKSTMGKIEADPEEMARAISESGFVELPVSAMHAAQVAKLPLLNDHKDPFDRLLVAQSMTEPLVLLSADTKVQAYGGLVRAV
ncbi:MAG: type II toxin-antitoxin system VapC family toxin [Zoogloeaceae bacterium]|nr:type II toxin-antitoxin system VapC family toxin [Zoogloeaceae bacterium]